MAQQNHRGPANNVGTGKNLTALYLGGLSAAAMFLVSSAPAATFPAGFSEFVVASGLSSPTAMEFAPDGRLFVCQQGGQLRVIKNLTLLPTPFLTVTTDDSGERGLLGIAFDPGFATNGFLYVYYTATSPMTHNRVSRFTAHGDVAVSGSETVLLDLETLGASNHNGGAIHFGADGRLYIATGENAVRANAQSLSTRLGKMLRINRDGTIPTDNPFYATATGLNRSIWALGLRNPFTFAVQPGTGRIFINDVGEGTWEEINEGAAGANYGWPGCEGRCIPSNPGYRNPIFQYAHGGNVTNGCNVTGGAFYNPLAPQYPNQYRGTYFFSDSCGGWIRRLDPTTHAVSSFASTAGAVDVKVSAEGRLFYLARSGGVVRAVNYTNAPPSLGTVRQGSSMLILWPSSASNFVLESSATLPASAGWTAVASPVTITNGQRRIVVSTTGTQFYRLMHP